MLVLQNITLTYLFNILRILSSAEMIIVSLKILIYIANFAQNIDCGYTLEPPY